MKAIYLILFFISITSVESAKAVDNNTPLEKKSKSMLLRPAKDAKEEDINFLPFSGWFTSINPQIAQLATCDSARLLGDKDHDDRIDKVVDQLRKNLMQVLKSVDDKATVHDLELDYNRAWWANKGYMEGVARVRNISVLEVANIQVQNCLKEHQL